MKALKVLGLILLCAVGLAVFGVIGAHERAEEARQAEAKAALEKQYLPGPELSLCNAVRKFSEQYEKASGAGANELKLSKLRTERAAELALIDNQPRHSTIEARGWIGKVTKLSTTSDQKAAVEVELPCGATVATWNNGLSDSGDHTLIPQGDKLYDAVAELTVGQYVAFDGSLFVSQKDGVRETSMTERGSMMEPVLLFRFKSLGPVPHHQ